MGYDLIARLLYRDGMGKCTADVYAYKNRSFIHECVPPKGEGRPDSPVPRVNQYKLHVEEACDDQSDDRGAPYIWNRFAEDVVDIDSRTRRRPYVMGVGRIADTL